MSAGVSITDLVVAGFAGFLDVNGLASWADVSGPYDETTEWPVYPGPNMPPRPHRMIAVTPTTIERLRADTIQGLQVRLRGLPDDPASVVTVKAQDIADLCYPNGFPRSATDLGYIRAGAILNGPETLLPLDGERRPEYVLNYRVRFRRPANLVAIGYTIGEGPSVVTSPDGSVRTIVAMTQDEYNAAPHDPTRAVLIIPDPPTE